MWSPGAQIIDTFFFVSLIPFFCAFKSKTRHYTNCTSTTNINLCIFISTTSNKGAMKHQKRGNIATKENSCKFWLQKLVVRLGFNKLLKTISIWQFGSGVGLKGTSTTTECWPLECYLGIRKLLLLRDGQDILQVWYSSETWEILYWQPVITWGVH